MYRSFAQIRIDQALCGLVKAFPGSGEVIWLYPSNQDHLDALHASSSDEYTYLIDTLAANGLIALKYAPGYDMGSNGYGKVALSITEHGFELAEQLGTSRVGHEFAQVLVYMHFHPDVETAYSRGIEPAIRSLGLKPRRIDHVDGPGDKDDIAIAEISTSGAIVVDLTNHRRSVYYELGCADRSGLPVIVTCRKDHAGEKEFYTYSRSKIDWENGHEHVLKERLERQLAIQLPHSQRS